MTVTEPGVASVLGVTVLGETLDTPGPQMFVLVAAVVAVIVATTALARGEAATIAADGDGLTTFPDRGAEVLARDNPSRVPSPN